VPGPGGTVDEEPEAFLRHFLSEELRMMRQLGVLPG
jgi:hypothetical protein